MATSEELTTLIERLLQATADGRVAWRSVRGTRFSYEFESSSGSVMVSSRDQDDAAPFVLMLRDEAGSVVGTFSTETDGRNARELEGPIETLYRTAQSSRVNRVVSGLLADIQGD